MADLPEGDDDVVPYRNLGKDDRDDSEAGAGETNQDASLAGGLLECPICLQPCMHPVELPCRHVFCYLCIKGVAMQGPNSKCAICRASIPYSVLTNPHLKDVSQLYKEPKLANGYQWYYESRSGGWWQYDERTMQDLERAFSSSQSTCQLLLAGHLYVVDFNQMIQYRLNNRNVSRRIRRGINLEKRGVAGIRISGSNTGAGSSGGTNSPPPGQSSGPSTRRRRGNSTPGGSQSSSASGHVHTPAAVSSDGGAATESQASHPSTTSSPPIQNDQRVSDSDDESEEDEDYDSDYSDADDDMELGEEEEALIGEDSDERETEDEEDYEARDGARAPTRRSDRSNSSNNQTPPPPSGSIAHGASNNRTYSPNPNGRGSRGARNGRSSGGGRSNNNGATSRSSAPLGYSDSSQSTASSNSNVISPIFFNRCNLEDGVTKTNVVNNNIFLDPQIIGQVNYAVSQTINNLSSPNSSSSTVKITFDRRSQLNQDEYL